MKIIPLNQAAVQPPKAIIFDWDNTLIHSRRVLHETMLLLADEVGIPRQKMMENELFSPAYNMPVIDAFPRLFGDNWPKMWQRASEIMCRERFKLMELVAGAAEFIELAAADQIPMSIVSNKEEEFLGDEVAHFGLTSKFYRILPSRIGHERKPHPQAAYDAFAPDLIPEKEYNRQIWFIGDSSVDIKCAMASGCLPILVGDVDPTRQDFAGTEGLHLAGFAEIAQLYRQNDVDGVR